MLLDLFSRPVSGQEEADDGESGRCPSAAELVRRPHRG